MSEIWANRPPSPEICDQRYLGVVPEHERSTAPQTLIEKRHADIDGFQVPFTVELPNEITDPVPLLLMNGYFGIEASSAALRKAIAYQGKPTITYKIQRGDVRHLFSGDHHLHPEKLHAQATHAVLRAIRDDYDAPQIDVAPHSMGGLTLASMSDKALQLVRQAHLMAPVGITTMSPVRLASHVPELLAKDVIPLITNHPFEVNSDDLRDVARYIINPVRLLTDGMAISFCDTRERLQAIRKIHQIPITVTWFMKDVVIGAHEGNARAQGVVDESLYFPDHSVGHNTPIKHPEAVGNHLFELTQRYAKASS